MYTKTRFQFVFIASLNLFFRKPLHSETEGVCDWSKTHNNSSELLYHNSMFIYKTKYVF